LATTLTKSAARLGLCGASLIALAAATPALAQSSEAARAQAPSSNELGEIVVTAQRREESSQRTAISLTVLSGEEIASAGLSSAEALSNLVPGVKISFEGAQAQVYVRGVGTFAANSLAEGSVAINVDGVYQARPSGVAGMFFDVDRIEVLKGPQGTLYGRNASAGAVNIITRNPILNEFGGNVSAAVGNYKARSFEGALNVPLNANAALRVSAQHAEHEGYLSDGTNDQDQTAARAKLLFQPSGDLRIVVSADYAKIKGHGPGAVDFPNVVSGQPWVGLTDPRLNAILVNGSVAALTARGTPLPVAQAAGALAALKPIDFLDYEPWGVSANVDVDLGFATWTLIPAYRVTKGTYYSNTGGFGFYDDEKSKVWTIENRLSGVTSGFNWVIGGYYFDEDMNYASRVDARPFINSTSKVDVLDDQTWAAFGQVSKELTTGLRLIGGLRYTKEKKQIAGSRVDFNAAGVARPGVFGGAADWKATNWKVGVEYDIAPKSMLYANVSTGFKAGGFTVAGSSILTFDPEKLTAYEIGSKNRFLDNSLQVNLSAYYWDYKNHQEPHLGPGPGGTVTFLTSNAGKATIKGAEASIIYRMTPQDTLSFDVEYNDSKYNSFLYDVNAGFATSVSTGCKIGPVHPVVIDQVTTNVNTIDCAGFELAKAPKWSGKVGYEHVFQLGGDAGSVVAGGDMVFSSKIWGGVDFIANQRLPDYSQVNLDLTYRSPDEAWSVMAYVRNVGDTAAYTNAFQAQFVPGLVHASILAPRTWGVRLQSRF
jgi:iron complex outermembrane receptor protein